MLSWVHWIGQGSSSVVIVSQNRVRWVRWIELSSSSVVTGSLDRAENQWCHGFAGIEESL